MIKSKSKKSTSENESSPKSVREDFLIAGIGASAAGIQVLKEFFENVPADSGVAYVVILHFSPEHDSRLAEVLQTTAQIPVTQVSERVKVEPNHVYVVPLYSRAHFNSQPQKIRGIGLRMQFSDELQTY